MFEAVTLTITNPDGSQVSEAVVDDDFHGILVCFSDWEWLWHETVRGEDITPRTCVEVRIA